MNRTLSAIALSAVMIACGACSSQESTDAQRTTVNGVLVAKGRVSTNKMPEGTCKTRQTTTARDVVEGAKVTIFNESGDVLAVTELEGGQYPEGGICNFPFTAEVEAGADAYGVQVNDRDTVGFSKSGIAAPTLTVMAE